MNGVIKRESHQLGGSLLDFGCGSKPYEALFCGSTNYVGVDIEVPGHGNEFKHADLFYDGKNLPLVDS